MRYSYFILLLIIGCLSSCVNKRLVITYATVIDDHYNSKGSPMQLEYSVKGKKITFFAGSSTSTALGEKYIIAYDSLHPATRQKILSWSQFFLSTEKTATVQGLITHRGKHWAEYEYTVNGIKWEKSEAFECNENWKKGEKCEVEYLIWDPFRSIIHHEK